jgi:hypothetical protein
MFFLQVIKVQRIFKIASSMYRLVLVKIKLNQRFSSGKKLYFDISCLINIFHIRINFNKNKMIQLIS